MQPPFRLSLALRLAAFFLGLILIVLAAESWLAWRNARERTLADAQEHLLGLAATLVRAAERRWSERPDEVRADIEFQAASPGHRATLLTDGRGRILAAHRRDWEGLSLPDVLPSLSLPLPPTALDALRYAAPDPDARAPLREAQRLVRQIRQRIRSQPRSRSGSSPSSAS